jgi:hypothetical protein
MSEKQIIKVNEQIEIVLETHYDEYPWDYENYGTTGSKVREWCVDRQLQVLLGESIPEPQWSERQEELEEKVYPYYLVKREEITDEEYEELEALRKEFDKEFEEWDKYHGLKVLSDEPYCWNTDAGRFWYPCNDYDDVDDEERIKYYLQENKRFEQLTRGEWCYLTYKVKVMVNGLKVASKNATGIESDMDRGDREEVWEELLSECLDDLNNKLVSKSLEHIKLGTELIKTADNLPEIDIKDFLKEIN